MRQDIEALHELSRIATKGEASKETLAQAASIIRRGTGAAEAMVVYAEDKKFLTCSHDDAGVDTELTLAALTWVQRHAAQASEPVAFNLVGRRVEDFTSALSDDDRQFLAFTVPTTESASEMCILRGPWEHKARPDILSFMQSAMPALTLILEIFLNANRSQRLGEQLRTLANAAQMLTRSEDVEAALTDLATAISASTGFEYIVNMDLYDAATGRFFLRVQSEQRYTGGTLGQLWKAGLNPDRPDPWNMDVMTTLQPALRPDMQNDPVYPEHVRKFFAKSLLRSTADFPLLFQDEFLGTIAFVSFKPSTFPPEEVSFLQGLATQAAMAIKAMQMHKELQRYAQEIKKAAEQYIVTTNLTGDVTARLDERGRWTFLNDAACQFYGKPREELLGADSTAYVHPEDLERTARSIREMRAAKAPVTGFVNRHVTPAGTRVVEWNGYPLFDEEGEYVGIQITGRDITERKQMEEALRDSEERYRDLFENATDLVQSVAQDGSLVYVNRAWQQALGYSEDEIAALSLFDIIHPDSKAHCTKVFQRVIAGEKVDHIEAMFLTKNGKTIWIEGSASCRFEDGKPVATRGIFHDITERKKAEEERDRLHAELEVKAVTDGLTGLYNHAHFYQRLDEEIERSKRYNHGFAVVMMDVNNFKQYNDSRGHQAGDEALRLLADCIRTSVRRSDLAFRYGGDEFAAILLHADLPRAQTVVDRINKRIAAGLRKMGDTAAAWLSLSAGVAWCPEDATTIDELIKLADSNLYNAKRVAWARGVIVQEEEAAESPASASEPVHERQSRMLSTAVSSLAMVLQDLSASELLADLNQQAIAAVKEAAENKSRYIRGHQERTSLWAAALAEEMGLPVEQVRGIRVASLLHDIGNVGVNDEILNKPGKLTKEEFTKIQQHAPYGAKIMVSEAEALQQLAKIVRHHHERYDGKGYPDGLAGKDIPLEARILSVVDSFDAMTQERSYRKALSREEAISELERSAGTQFDPAVVKAFLALVKEPRAESPAPTQAASKDRQPAAATAVKRKGR